MADDHLKDYMERLTAFSKNVSEQQEVNITLYYQKIFFYLKACHSNIQAIYESYITDSLKKDDCPQLQSVFLHAVKTKLLPASSSGYDHCDRLWVLLDLLACDDFDQIYRLLPQGLPIAANGFPMFIHGTNVLLCLLYPEDTAAYQVDKIIERAETFTTSKKPLWERSVISCLLGIQQQDITRISESLQQVCEGFAKIKDTARYMKLQCQNAYGLIILAKHFLPEGDFTQIIFPEHKNFSKNYMLWLLEQERMPHNLCVTYDTPMEQLNEFLKKPAAITRIYQPYLNSDNSYLSAKEKKANYMDLDRMLIEFLQ